MAAVKKEWVELIKDAITVGYNARKITSIDDLNRVALKAANSLGIEDKRLRASAITMAKADHPILIHLRQKAAEMHLPITKDSPTAHLPISKRTHSFLYLCGLRQVGNLVFLLEKAGVDGLYAIRNLKGKGVKEILDALAWAGIDISAENATPKPSEEEREFQEAERRVLVSGEMPPPQRIILSTFSSLNS